MTINPQPPGPPIIGVHIDLKGTNFKPAYIPVYLADLASQGVNTVLVEYEDVFPFRDIDIAFDRTVTWKRTTLRRFLDEAKRHSIQVIPLQQCLGHLEYVLSWERYRHLAEDQDSPTTIRPGDPAAAGLVITMLEQVVAAHPDSKYVHLGMDEAHGLTQAAARLGIDPLDLFVEQLSKILEVVERAGKRAIIWSDMAERYFRPGAFDAFKGRVVFMPWYYFPLTETTPLAPLGGRRNVSRRWLDEPDHPDAPGIDEETTFIEDLPSGVKRALAPYRRGRLFQPLLEVEVWTRQGMDIIGGSALRFTRNGSVLPPYHQQFSNVRGWSKTILRSGQLGQIGTSWARSTSWGPPNYNIDLQWPIITEMARSMGAKPKPFWPGIPSATTSRIFKALGRCREDWQIEGAIADEMESLAPQLKAHHYEWKSIILMARTLELQRRIDANVATVDKYRADSRPIDAEWNRLIQAQTRLLRELAVMKRSVHPHFNQRFHGAAYREWIRHLFDLRTERLKTCRPLCRANVKTSRQRYA